MHGLAHMPIIIMFPHFVSQLLMCRRHTCLTGIYRLMIAGYFRGVLIFVILCP